jgi:plasmid maintenance system antidote protein VapI
MLILQQFHPILNLSKLLRSDEMSRAFSMMLKDAKSKVAYWVEAAKLDFALELTRHMKEKSVSNAELASRLETSPAYITKLLRGDGNLTIETMVKATRAIDCDFHIHISHRNATVKWLDVISNDKANPEASRWVQNAKVKHHDSVSIAA